MKTLAIDSSTPIASVALLIGEQCISKQCVEIRQHAKVMLPMIESVLAEAGLSLHQLDMFAYCRGPGSFTGVRISASIIQGLAFGSELPVVGVSSLKAIAWLSHEQHQQSNIIACIDARMNELYWAQYRVSHERVLAMTEENVSSTRTINDNIDATGESFIVAGSGLENYKSDLLKSAKITSCLDVSVQAEAIAHLARTEEPVDASEARPVYVRNSVVGG